MRVDIVHDGKVIGSSNLDAADPPMGVASGPFEPSAAYEPETHAGEIDGGHDPAGADLPLIVQSMEHGVIEQASVFIQDYRNSLDEMRVSVLGIPYPAYETYFGNSAVFKEYWSRA